MNGASDEIVPTATPSKNVPRRRRRIGWIFAAAIAVSCHAIWSYAQERHDLPPFDAAKAQSLSPERRSEYERLLFNEIPPHNAGSRRHDIWSREKEWLRMADEGFELAYITLQVLSPTRGKFALEKPLARLEVLTNQGDAAAMCLYRQLVTWGQQSPSDFEKYNSKAVEYMEKGAAFGHPECVATKGATLLRGAKAGKENRQKGFEMLVTAARAGYAGGAYGLFGYFMDKNLAPKKHPLDFVYTYNDMSALERDFCWDSVINSNFAFPSNNPGMAFASIDAFAARFNRSDLKRFSEHLKKMPVPSLEHCIELGLGE